MLPSLAADLNSFMELDVSSGLLKVRLSSSTERELSEAMDIHEAASDELLQTIEENKPTHFEDQAESLFSQLPQTRISSGLCLNNHDL